VDIGESGPQYYWSICQCQVDDRLAFHILSGLILVGPVIIPQLHSILVNHAFPGCTTLLLLKSWVPSFAVVVEVSCQDRAHQQKTYPSGRNGSVRVDALHQSRQRHPGGGLLRARRQYHASRCTSPSDRSFAVSSSDSARAISDAPQRTCSYGGAFRTLRDWTIMIVKFWSSAGDLVPYSQSSGS